MSSLVSLKVGKGLWDNLVARDPSVLMSKHMMKKHASLRQDRFVIMHDFMFD